MISYCPLSDPPTSSAVGDFLLLLIFSNICVSIIRFSSSNLTFSGDAHPNGLWYFGGCVVEKKLGKRINSRLTVNSKWTALIKREISRYKTQPKRFSVPGKVLTEEETVYIVVQRMREERELGKMCLCFCSHLIIPFN